MHLLTLPIIGLVIGKASAHTVEVLSTPCPSPSLNQDETNYFSPEPDHPEASTILVEDPTTLEPTVLPTIVDSEHSAHMEQVTTCETTESAWPTVPNELVPESIYYQPPIESEIITVTSLELVTPCDATQPSVPTTSYEPESEYNHHVQPVVTPEILPSKHVQTMATEPRPDCTESTEDAPIQHPEPETDIIHATSLISEVLGPTAKPSKYDVPEPHLPVSAPLSEPVQPPVPTEPIHTPVDEPTVISQEPQPAPSSFKTVTSLAAEPTVEIIKLNLSDATLGLYATFIEIKGRRAIRLAPPPYGEASFTLRVNDELDFFPDSLVSLGFLIKFGDICPNPKRKTKLLERADTRNRFIVNADGKKVVDEEAQKTNGKFRRGSADQLEAQKGTFIDMSLLGGPNPVDGTVSEVNFH